MNEFKRQWEVVGSAVLSATNEVGQKGWYILGEEVTLFEKALSEYFTLEHAVGVANGMDALEIALRCLGVKPQDKVLTTPLSAFATTLAIMKVGAEPVFVDVDENGLLDLGRVEKLLQDRNDIRFMVPVHLYGLSLDLNHLERLQKKYSISIIEDCAQSIGASFRGRLAGTVGSFAATSFYPTKNLGALGDGGALLTQDAALFERAKSIRNYGQSAHYVHTEFGLNSRLDELQAALLRKAILPHLSGWTERRQVIAQRYLSEIKNQSLSLLKPKEGVGSVWHLFPILLTGERSSFQNFLKDHGISTGLHYPHLMSDQEALRAYGRYEVVGELRQAQVFAKTQVSLPIHPFLSDQEVDRVIEACNLWRG